jgi:hypothetical protein
LSPLQFGSSTQCLWINSSLSIERAVFIGGAHEDYWAVPSGFH